MSRVNTSNLKIFLEKNNSCSECRKLQIIHPKVLKLLENRKLDSPMMRVKDEFQPKSGDLKTHLKKFT